MVVLKSRYGCARVFRPFAVSATKGGAPTMAQVFRPSASSIRRIVGRSFLAFFWLGGLLCGIWFYSAAGMPLFPGMRDGPLAPVSIHRMLCITLLPFLLSSVAAFVSSRLLLYLLAFSKAFSLACVGLSIQVLWGEAGWLMRWLFSFGSFAGAPVLYWFLSRHVGREGRVSFPEVAWVFSAAAWLGSIHYFVIAPVLARLIHF